LVFRLEFNQLLGPRVHVFDGSNELIFSPLTMKLLDGSGTPEDCAAALRWMAEHRHQILFQWRQSEQRQAAAATR
jgi:hypothetical protein